jgi:type VI protein secretion system component VasK
VTARRTIRATRRRRALAFAGALVLALAGLAFLGLSISQHQDARDELAQARARFAANQASSSKELTSLQDAQEAIAPVREQLAALDQGSAGLADLDQRDLEAVRAAVQAGLAGALADYNGAVDQRATLDPQHDAAVEQLRLQANSVITALDPVS